ncbi:hypothetical protein NQ317_017548 [Molorchus minor]|uniref:Uncharacterized protein n=1 Tax=Molorchus minor TaxID=1323400 RepID=A0ABQ9JBQ0_9CUCU|nr:hypothetical protein NQ317_017548 [Molorchus minor]
MSPTREDYVKPNLLKRQKNILRRCSGQKKGLSPFESPDEDITSSLRDEPASPDQIIEASFVVDQPGVAEETSDAQQLFKEATTAVPHFCPFSTSTVQDIQQVVTADIHSFESSEPPPPQSLDLDHPLMKCVYPLPTEGQQIDIKTENITPEFAEPAIVTPSEESKQEEVPTAPLDDVVLAAAAVATAATALGVAAVADKVSGKAEKEEKKPVSSITKKATTAKTGTSKTTPKTSTKTSKTPTSRLSSSPKTVPAKSSMAKPTLTATPRPITTKPSPKPKLPTTTPRSTEKKPLTNGDTQNDRSVYLGNKENRFRHNYKIRNIETSYRRTATTKTSSSTTSAFGTSAKPRPTSLISRTATSTTTKPATTTRSPPTKTTSPRTTTDPRPKLPTSTTLSKPRVPLTKTITKTADAEKQNKESANKLTASRSVTSATRTASGARTTTTTMRKFERARFQENSRQGVTLVTWKATAATTTRTNKTTTTTMKSTTAKKPAELVRNAANKTKTTKVEKPKRKRRIDGGSNGRDYD